MWNNAMTYGNSKMCDLKQTEIKNKSNKITTLMPSSVLQISCPPHHVTHFHTSQINLECIKLTWWHEGLVQFWLFGWFRADGLFSSFSQPEQTDSSPPVSPAHLCRMADPAAWSSTFNASLTCHKQHGSFPWSPPLYLSRALGGGRTFWKLLWATGHYRSGLLIHTN